MQIWFPPFGSDFEIDINQGHALEEDSRYQLANNNCHLSHTSDSRASGQFKFGVTGATFRILHLAVDDNTMDNDDSDLWLMPHSIFGVLV